MNHQNPEDYSHSQRPENVQDEAAALEDSMGSRPRVLLILVTLLVVLAMLATLARPLLRAGPRRQPTPTPTPVYFQTA
jgi:hypothetical protein